MTTISNFFRIINHRTLIVIAMAVGATWFCRKQGLATELPTTLIGIAVVFPIVFSINSAYRRREEALKYLASIKGHVIALAFAARDWTPADKGRVNETLQKLGPGLFRALTKALANSTQENFNAVYNVFSKWSSHHEALREAGVSGSEISRANQYLRAVMIEFERMRNITRYRTPITLRAYSKVFLHSVPVLFAPHFAHLANESVYAGYFVAAVYSLVFVSLDIIQDRLEHPFDQDGVDDVRLDVTERYAPILGMEVFPDASAHE